MFKWILGILAALFAVILFKFLFNVFNIERGEFFVGWASCVFFYTVYLIAESLEKKPAPEVNEFTVVEIAKPIIKENVIPEELESETVIILSTGHLPHNEFVNLADGVDMYFRAIQHEYGVILILTTDFTDPQEMEPMMTDISVRFPALNKIILWCIEHDVRYINFDQDGIEFDSFEKFNW